MSPEPWNRLSAVQVHDDPAQLNALIRTNVNSQHMLEEASELVQEQDVRELLSRLAEQRREQATELARYVSDKGGRPDLEDTFGGKLQRVWMNLRAAVSSGDALMVLEEAERAEDHIKQVYDDARVAELPQDAQELLTRHEEKVHASHARVRDLRDAYAEQHE